MARKVNLYSRGIAELLKSAELQRIVKVKAEGVANKVRSMNVTVGAYKGKGEIDLPVKVETSITDRARATVIIEHPAGDAVQAKYGALTKAAAQMGLDVRSRK